MTLRQMEYLIAVADTGSFSRAAQALNVSQPGLSQQVRQLEREVGAVLIERLPRMALLTPAGRAYLPEARRAVAAATQARRAARATAEGVAGDLEIATVLSVAAGVLPRSIARFHRRHANVVIRLSEYRHNTTLQKEFLHGTADLAVGPEPEDWDGPAVDLGTEEFVIVLPRSDPMAADHGVIDVADLADRDWVLFERHNGLSEITEQVCRAAGFSPRGVLHTTQVSAGVRLAAAGLGPMMVPDNVVPTDLDAAVMRMKQPFHRRLSVYGRSEFSPLAQAYIRVLCNTPARLVQAPAA
ncbi:LysR family transcriptional regulator [Dactylosporangium sp. NPDC005572]|uniref:LysR family transcriptional regulator n=1 Tax=Dactylosporangium sp. NPDC005572 TaxID=3156889 RepID=UPI00339EFF88